MSSTTETQPKIDRPPVAIVNRRRFGLVDWFTMSTDEVLSRFASLKGAQRIGTGEQQFVYIPGTRDDKVLLVAHADTVWRDEPIRVVYSGGYYFSVSDKRGIGADDRAGCCMLWHLRKMGHSLLIPNAEEGGCKGSRFLMSMPEWKKIVNEHRFAIEMDRMNDSDMAFYSVGSDKFKNWCEEQFKGYKRTHGSWTDICVLCDPMCGMNISVGYYGQHSAGEYLNESEWEKTLQAMSDVLSKKDLPRFEQDPKPAYTSPSYSGYCGYSGSYTDYKRKKEPVREFSSMEEYRSHRYAPNFTPSPITYSAKQDDIIVCLHCEGVMDMSEYKANNNKCIFDGCGKEF